MKQAHRRSASLLLPLLASCVADSRWPLIETQKWPAPMQAVSGAVDSGALRGVVENKPGVEKVLVLRYGDPVQVRPAGATAAYPLPFHDKEVQLHSGSSVLCSPGGKVEILWEGGTSIVFSGRTTGLVGSKSRLEPTFAFVELENATLNLRQGDQVRLLGGALLSADVGPIALERLNSSVVRVENQSKAEARLMFREADFRLAPGEELHFPLLSDGGTPLAQAFDVEGGASSFPLRWYGSARASATAEGALVTAGGATALRGLGLELELGEGDALFVEGLSAPATPQGGAPPAEPAAPVAEEGAVEQEREPEPEAEAEPKVEPEPVPEDEWVPVDGLESQGGGA
ncbi:MAG: hypothetical protein MK297_02070 [Planctomycetes bacterium]|nr:hypothetical protein [Planctomycetota bacterium]